MFSLVPDGRELVRVAPQVLTHGCRVVHHRSGTRREALSGATFFVVDAGIDTGVIVAQTVVPVDDCDRVDTLTERIKSAERPQLVEFVGRMAREGYSIVGRRCVVGPPETVRLQHPELPLGAGQSPTGVSL